MFATEGTTAGLELRAVVDLRAESFAASTMVGAVLSKKPVWKDTN